ncbi:MAG: NAD(P)H-dependent oxidoreductase [Deltaproteobacteria bacterium]
MSGGLEPPRVLLFDGSANPGSSIAPLLERVREALAAEGLEAELARLERNRFTGCTMCGECGHRRDLGCARPPADGLRRCARKLLAADGVVIGTPAYGAGVSPATQRLMAHLEQRRQVHGEQPLAGKVAAAVVDVRNARSQHSLAVLTQWFRANGMVVVDEAGVTRREDRAATGRAADEADAAMARVGRAVASTLRRLRA